MDTSQLQRAISLTIINLICQNWWETIRYSIIHTFLKRMQHVLFNKWSIIKAHSIFKISNGTRRANILLNRCSILWCRGILMKWRSSILIGDMLCRSTWRRRVRWLVSRIYRTNLHRRLRRMLCRLSPCKTMSSWHKVVKVSKSPVTSRLAAQSKLMCWFQLLNRNRQSIEKSKKTLTSPQSNLLAIQNHQPRQTQLAFPSATSFPVTPSTCLEQKCKQSARYLNITPRTPKMETN